MCVCVCVGGGGGGGGGGGEAAAGLMFIMEVSTFLSKHDMFLQQNWHILETVYQLWHILTCLGIKSKLAENNNNF